MLIIAFANCFLLLVTNLLIKGVKTIKLKLDKYRILRFKILKKNLMMKSICFIAKIFPKLKLKIPKYIFPKIFGSLYYTMGNESLILKANHLIIPIYFEY